MKVCGQGAVILRTSTDCVCVHRVDLITVKVRSVNYHES